MTRPTSQKAILPISDDQPPSVIVLERIAQNTVPIRVVGITPLIPHRWSEKARRMMPGGPDHGKKVTGKREPEQEAAAASYYLPDGRPGIPATAFKSAMVGAVRLMQSRLLTMVAAKQLFFVEGEGAEQLVPIEFGERALREDTPRNSNGGADLRYRYAYFPWSATLAISFLPNLITLDSVVNLVDAAGNGGVGDWRPSAPKSATGTFGRFRIEEEK